jgi:proton-dependent oligopeptide transporter, POT family
MKTQRQPKGTYVLFLQQLLGMVGFSMLFSLLVLYSTNKLGFTDNSAYAIMGSFNALAFALSVPAAYIAERFLGFRFATFASIILSVIGLVVICIPTTSSIYLGLGIFLVGTGMIIPCLYILLGRLYEQDADSNNNCNKDLTLAYQL